MLKGMLSVGSKAKRSRNEALQGAEFFIIEYDEVGDEVSRERVPFGDRRIAASIAHDLTGAGCHEVEHHFKGGRSRGFMLAT